MVGILGFTLFALEFSALATGEGGGGVLGAWCWVPGGRTHRGGIGVLGARCWVPGCGIGRVVSSVTGILDGRVLGCETGIGSSFGIFVYGIGIRGSFGICVCVYGRGLVIGGLAVFERSEVAFLD